MYKARAAESLCMKALEQTMNLQRATEKEVEQVRIASLIATLTLNLSRVNLLISFSAWAELVWRYLPEVTNTVNPSSIPGSSLKTIILTLTLTRIDA